MTQETYVVKYLGLPDCQYKDITVWASSYYEARELADSKLLQEYGNDSFDCLGVFKPDFNKN